MAQIILISSINAASGKTTLAAHLGVMLAREYRTAVMDSAGGNSDLAAFIARRYTINLSRNINMPVPEYHSLDKNTFQEIQDKYDVILLDSPHEKYFKQADIWITPIRGEEGLKALTEKNSLYAALVWQAKKQRAAEGKNAFRWIVIPQEKYSAEINENLAQIGKFWGYAAAPVFPDRPEYAQGLKSGMTVLDKDLPALKTLFELPDMYARRDLKKLAEFIWSNK